MKFPLAAMLLSLFIPAHALTPSYQGLWWNAPAGSESGWGINIAHQGDTLFVAWFTYDARGAGLWLVMSNGVRVSDEAFQGILHTTTGDPFSAVPWSPSNTRLTEVGRMYISFSDSDNGVFSYSVNGAAASKFITRNVFATPVPTCEIGGVRRQPWNFQDLWWRSPAGSESGWGLSIAHQGDTIFATWFSYDAAGKGTWFVLPDGAKTGPNAYAGALYRTSGPPFSTAPWISRFVRTVAAGTATLSFSDADNGTFAYTVDGISQAKPITRQVYSNPPTVCN
jgi:hypothetical protein